MSSILIIGEHDGKALNPATAKCVHCAQAIGGDIDIAIFGSGIGDIAAQAAALDSVRTVFAVDAEHLGAPLAANWAAESVALADDYSHILGASTTLGRDLMPRIAALLGVNQVSDIMEVSSSHAFKRPIYAGNAIVDVQCAQDQKVVATVRAASWQAVDAGGNGSVESRRPTNTPAAHTRYVGLRAEGGERPDLQTAARVISGGRGVGSVENFEIIYQLADRLGAGVGASRAAVDAGYCPNDMQVGQTGKIIAPDLYVAFGISGAIQHVTGIKDAGTIVAVNKDSEAPIFEVSDIGLVGDLFKVIPELESLLG
jgi:electron transfer flavoprotein alpha subunit